MRILEILGSQAVHYYPLPAHVKRLILSIKHDVRQESTHSRRQISRASFEGEDQAQGFKVVLQRSKLDPAHWHLSFEPRSRAPTWSEYLFLDTQLDADLEVPVGDRLLLL